MYPRGLAYILLGLFMTVFTARAQLWHLSYYTVNEGLVSNYINRIFQDSRGYIWISTLDGLSKYDGHKFTNYTTANGLEHNLVNDLLEYEDGRLFIACNDGSLALMMNDKIIKVTRPGAVINQFHKTPTGKILVVADKRGIQEFDKGVLHQPPQPYPHVNYYSITTLNDSLLLAGTDSSVQILSMDYRLVKRIENPVYSYFGAENKVFKDSRGRLWASNLPGLAMLSTDGLVAFPASLRNEPLALQNIIKQIFEDKEGDLWFAGLYGLMQLTPNDQVNVFGKVNGLLSDRVTCVFQDREDNFWIGTSVGLCKMSGKKTVTHFGGFYELSGFIGWIFVGSTDRLITGTPKGWKYFYKHNEEWSHPIDATTTPYAIQKNIAGHPPLRTDNGFPVLKNTKAGRDLERFFLQQKPPVIAHVAKDKHDNVFLTNDYRFYIYDGKKVYADSTIPDVVTCMAIDKEGALLAGTWANGLIRIEYENSNGIFRIIKKETLLPTEYIRAVQCDREGNIWTGTRYNGLFRLRRNDDEGYAAEQWNTEKGLSSNWIRKIAIDEKGNVWMAHSYGLDKLVNKGNNKYHPFNFSHINNFFGDIYQVLPDSNYLWLATANGLVRLLDNEMENKSPWPVYITTVSLGDSTYHPSAMPATLAYGTNSLRFDFSSPTYINEKQVLYSYRLTGGNENAWSSPQNLHSVSFASLRPGDYRFEVRSLGWNGQWGTPTVASFTVLPPLWARGWFLSLIFLLLAIGITMLVRRRIKVIRHEAEMKQQLAETEMMALRAQMNPHFLFNSLNAIDSLIQTHQSDKATTYLGRFAKLLRLVLDSSKNKLVPFDKDFTALQLYLDMEKFRSGGKFQFDITAEAELLNGGYRVPPLLVHPFIENAIYHGLLNKRNDDRLLTIDASLQDEFIVFKITDNGVGRVRAHELNSVNRPEHVSYGLQITTQRLGLHNGGNGEDYITIQDLYANEEPCGTRVELKIKVNT